MSDRGKIHGLIEPPGPHLGHDVELKFLEVRQAQPRAEQLAATHQRGSGGPGIECRPQDRRQLPRVPEQVMHHGCEIGRPIRAHGGNRRSPRGGALLRFR